MLRNSLLCSGRWNSLDFLKGRGKCAGAIHVRSTLGSRGRAKFYTKQHGYRDGLPHDSNKIKGALGVRLGGGLFGARMEVPEVSQMDKELVDVMMYGHPSITNPFREQLLRHPRLGAVVAGPTGSAWLAFPVGDAMWHRDQDEASENKKEVRAKLRMRERSFVVENASSFLLEATKESDVWSERQVVLGGVSSSVVLSARTMMHIFGEHTSSEAKQSEFSHFVHNCIVDAHRYCVKSSRFSSSRDATDSSVLLPTQFLRSSSTFQSTLLEEVPCALKTVLPPFTSPPAKHTSPSTSVNTLIKWYLRTSDPRSHYGSGGHAERRFSFVAVCPFAQPRPLWLSQLRRQGFSDVSERDAAKLLELVAHGIVDDSSGRVPLSAAQLAAVDPRVDKEQHDDESIWVGDEKPYVEAAHQLFPHLTARQQRLVQEPSMVENKHLQYVSREGMAKSYMAPF